MIVGSREKQFRKRSARAGLLLVLVAAITLEATSLIQLYFAQCGIRSEASRRAETQLEATHNQIMDVVNQTETAVRNSEWIAQWCLDVPDSLPRVSWRVVHDNPTIMGSTVALLPDYCRRYPLYAPYCYRDADTSLTILSLATPEYDYPAQPWFRIPLELETPYWSEPYYDEGGGEALMTTFSFPIKDLKGKFAAVLTADIALDWLADMVGNIKVYPHASSLLISRAGHLVVNKSREALQNQALTQAANQMHDNLDFQKLDAAMRSGQSGTQILKYDKERYHVFYAPVERIGWSMCIVVPERDIYSEIRRTGIIVSFFQVFGLALLIIILHSFVREQLKFQALEEKRERMAGDLEIASHIQMSMVPKSFPPFPDRHDLDLAADILPSQEVGGDLYDFFIIDEKLYFCIGDVSGKGIPASLVMAVTRTSFRNLSSREKAPGRIVSAMNDSLSTMNENNFFVTFFCGTLDLAAGKLCYCNAGHNPPMLLTDSIRPLDVKPNLPLGIMPGWDFEEQEIDFHYDNALFLFTDGLTEAENANHEQFGEERMAESLHGRKGAYDHLQQMEKQVKAFVGNAPQSDDLTMLFIHFLGRSEYVRGGKQLILYNDVKQISRLEGWLEALSEDMNLDPILVPSLNLALEEAVTNVVLYAYPQGTYGSVELEANLEGNTLTFVLSDSGKPFDPTSRPEVDITASAEDRPIGGLGVHLVRQIMDHVQYEWKDGYNVLTMTKNI